MKRITLLFTLSLFINGVFGDEVSVMEGDSVTLHTNTVIQAFNGVSIIWKFGAQKTRIAQINKANNNNIVSIYADVLDGKFRGRLQLNNQTGDLTITDITTTDSGLYTVEIHVENEETQKNSFDVKGVVGAGGVKSVSVMEGDSVTLYTDDPDIQKYDVIRWRFQHKNSPIAEINRTAGIFSTYDNVLDGIFRDKLQLDIQTGFLDIRNIRTKHSGLYQVDIISTRSNYTIHQSFTVTVSDKVKSVSLMEGDPVTLQTHLTELQKDDLIKWWFVHDDSLIAQIYKLNKLSRTYDGEEGKFRGRLKLNNQTGDLTITDSKTEHTGLYEVEMSDKRRSIQRRFSVHISERSLSSGAKAVIYIVTCVIILLLIAAAAAGAVMYDHRKDERHEVYEGESVDLKTKVTDIQKDDLIEWIFNPGEPMSQICPMLVAAMKRVLGFFKLNETLIAKINPANNIFSTYDGDDDLFRDKLNLNPQTGDLTINDIREEHTGVYLLKIIRDGKTTEKRFNVFVRVTILEVNEGESVDLKTEVTDIQRDDEIEWTFKETLIAEINPVNNIFRTYGDYDLFKDKLKLNHQTGDLNINDIRQEHSGVYILKITRSGETSYRRFNVHVRYETEELTVYEGEPANLETKLRDIKKDDVIEWRFRETLIAEINPANNIFSTYNGDDDLFRDKLKLNHKTGNLNINDTRWEHTGVYILKIIRGEKNSYKRLYVSVRYKTEILEVKEGESVDLKTKVTDIKRVDLLEWRFGETLIAKINPASNIFSTYDDDKGLFKDKLKLNRQTGDLNINDFREEHNRVYTLKIIRDGKTSYKRFRLFIIGETKILEVKEGESVNLETKLKDIKRDDVIAWRFEETLIAEINHANNIPSTYIGDKGLFRDKLKLNDQTGDLTINDFKREHNGVYILKIIRDGKTSERRFVVSVRGETKILEVKEGESVDLKAEVTDIQRDDVIEWRFRDKETLIAEINPSLKSLKPSDKGLFRDKLTLNPQTGDLNIKDIRQEHTGVYLLKITRDGETSDRKFSVFVRCNVEVLRVDVWKSVDLKTEVTDIQEVDLIEWRFGETLIAEINPVNNIFRTYYGDDDLFRDKLKLNPETGDLNINDIREKQRGEYILKIIKGEETYRRFRVIVRDKMKPLSVYEGDSVPLKTKVTDIQKVDLIEWRFGETLIAKINPAKKLFNTYDDEDLFRDKLKLNPETGDLNINDIRQKHTGVYKLKIINYGLPPCPNNFFVLVSARGYSGEKRGGDSEEKRGKDSEEKRGKDSEEKRGKDSEEKRGKDSEKRGEDSERKSGEDSVRIEMQPLLNKRQ